MCQLDAASWEERRAKLARAEDGLQMVDAKALTREEVGALCDPSAPSPDTLRPYLVRAVSQSLPYYAVVRFEPDSRRLFICQVGYNLEMALPDPDFRAWPAIVFLPAPPSMVYVRSVYGGDWIFGREGEATCLKPK